MISRSSLDATYFDDIFANNDDPWDLATSEYEAKKFQATHDAIADRRYARALEVGCAQGVLTGKLAPLCDNLLAVDIASGALVKARVRVGDRPGLELAHMAFPMETPGGPPFDLVILSEIAYYWGVADLDRASEWLRDGVAQGGRLILVHYTGKTDYPHSADEAVGSLWSHLDASFVAERSDRNEGYRLDLWQRR